MATLPPRADANSVHEDRDWLRATLACIGDAVIATDPLGIVTLLNPVAQSLTGWTQGEALGMPLTRVFNVVQEESRLPIVSPVHLALAEGAAVRMKGHCLLVAKNGAEIPIDDSASPIRNAAGKIVGVVLVFRDITERKRADEDRRLDETNWRMSEIRYRRLFETARDGILILDERTGKITDANPYMSELLGYDHTYFIGKELWEIGLFKDIAENRAAFAELQQKGYIRYDHLPLETRDKKKVEVEFVSNSYEADGQLVIQCNIRDGSERFRLEREIRASLDEKEVLLKEIHHRVKNNLQVISSLLQLQSLQTKEPASVQMFRDSQNRVRSMALVHERLYQSKDLSHVNFTEYIESLSAHLFSSHLVDSDRVRLKVDTRDVKLSIHAAVPCGLILNELISNCLKHAFAEGQHGTIRIEVRPVSDSEIRLSVSDDGVGLPDGIEPRSAETFGMQLISDLADQIHGRVEIDRNPGTTVRIVFPTAVTNSLQRKDPR